MARDVAHSTANASVNSPAPHGGYSRVDGKIVVIVRDPEHQLLGRFVAHPLGQDADFFRSLVPNFWVVEMLCNGHEARLASRHGVRDDQKGGR